MAEEILVDLTGQSILNSRGDSVGKPDKSSAAKGQDNIRHDHAEPSTFSTAGAAATALYVAVFLVVLYLTSLYNYLLFHSIVEIFCVVVACTVFFITWNTRDLIDKGGILLLGISYFYIAVLDLVHALAFQGMGVFHHVGPDLPTQLWICARSIEAVSFFLVPLLLHRRLRPWQPMLGYFVVTTTLLVTVFGGIFPRCFVEGQGLTLFKRVCEYVIIVLIASGMVGLIRRRLSFQSENLYAILAAMAFTIIAELMFTLYASLYGFLNLLGHELKLVSFLFVYQVLVAKGIRKPVSLLFQGLEQAKDALAAENMRLVAIQQELALKNKRLQVLDEQKNLFLGMAAHDLRNPISAIRGHARLLLEVDDLEREQAESALTSVKRASEHMLHLVENLLDVSVIESGKLELSLRSSSLSELLARRLEFFLLLAKEKSIKLITDVPQDIVVEMDPHRMEQVIDNLISNAVKYSPSGRRVWVSLSRDSDTVRLTVRDEGPGLSNEDQSRLFGAFSRLSSRPTAGERSTGLGLVISQRIVNAHHGTITVDSRLGEGSTFTVTQPISLGAAVFSPPLSESAAPTSRRQPESL